MTFQVFITLPVSPQPRAAEWGTQALDGSELMNTWSLACLCELLGRWPQERATVRERVQRQGPGFHVHPGRLDSKGGERQP